MEVLGKLEMTTFLHCEEDLGTSILIIVVLRLASTTISAASTNTLLDFVQYGTPGGKGMGKDRTDTDGGKFFNTNYPNMI